MTDTDVRDVLARATDHLSPAPDLLDRVRTRGRRRVVRRRTVLGGALAVVAAAGAAPALSGNRTEPRRVTRGDLAGDAALLERMRAAWQAAMPHATGEITVRWAGTTAAGPVGLLSQPSEGSGLDLQGFVETVDGQLRGLGGTRLVARGTVAPVALATGVRRDQLIIVTGDQAVHLSENYTIDAAGRVTRRFVTLHGDLVFQRRVRSQRYALRVGDEPVPVAPSSATTAPSPVVPYPQKVERVMPGAPATAPDRAVWDVSEREGYLDPYGVGVWTGPTEWYLRGMILDGRQLVVQTLALNGRARAFCLAAPPADIPEARYLGDSAAGLTARLDDGGGKVVPVLYLRLPSGIGWVVAAPDCQLRYRVRDGSALPVAGDAALIPAAATELEVTSRAGRSASFVLR
ncbi:hypothetical protein Aab01nite_14240 [Paractinoplanes abujensis]|uniref:Uncharacterized protein n=1 Tax=Paractinoplanes abujensis TaxID=882441 RepID=A0A7W7CPC5_9ACTN|nr:hypothetical protein [Actinoplanes abujensis]MBB4690753.1 hypothetical protein [Actinoplanes abujensis]GID17834.1 hypothetical protein Aab01nite_14240 [Actinoplanes abujensis]